MPIFTRTAGDVYPVKNVDAGLTSPATTTDVIIAPGLTKTPTIFKILLGNSQNFTAAEMDTGGAVETILRAVGRDSTIVMYQVQGSGGQMDVCVEATGTDAAGLQTRLRAFAGNIGAAANVYMGGGVTVTNATLKSA